MIPSEMYCYVRDGKIADFPDNFIQGRGYYQTTNPFGRPIRVGDTIIPENWPDEDLKALGIYRIYIVPPTPEDRTDAYSEIGPFTVEGDNLLRRDFWVDYSPEDLDIIAENIKNESIDEHFDRDNGKLQREILLRAAGLKGLLRDVEYQKLLNELKKEL